MTRQFPGDVQYVVTAPLAVIRTLSGIYEHHYSGELVPPADPRQLAMLLESGMIAPVREGS